MVLATLNYLGYPIESNDIKDLLSNVTDQSFSVKRRYLDSFFGIPVKNLNKDILKRYIETTNDDLYIGILPHDEELLENLLQPHKSAKKCFCFGEYLATIELCGHIAEMLATLLFLMNRIKINSQEIDEKAEENLFGKSFKALDQHKRLKILKTFNILNDVQYCKFTEIRKIRNKYYHLWGQEKDKIKSDAFECFSKITYLIKKIIEIQINNNQPQNYGINTSLKLFLAKRTK